jgi:hypothetical protein
MVIKWIQYGLSNPYIGAGTSATLRRIASRDGGGTTNAIGILSFGMTVKGTLSHSRNSELEFLSYPLGTLIPPHHLNDKCYSWNTIGPLKVRNYSKNGSANI